MESSYHRMNMLPKFTTYAPLIGATWIRQNKEMHETIALK
jgi:hypothetical protein